MNRVLKAIDFVSGDLQLLNMTTDRCAIMGRCNNEEHSLSLQKSDVIVFCNNAPDNSWVCVATVKEFDLESNVIIADGEPEKIDITKQCYVGIINRGKKDE